MTNPVLYAHPFSSYCQKVLIALYENAVPFEYRQLGAPDGKADAELAQLWPVKRFPVLVDRGIPVLEATIIIEYLDQHYPGPAPMLPRDSGLALDVRMLDRIFDNYVMSPMQKMVFNALRPAEGRDAYGVSEAGAMLDKIYPWLDAKMAGREWAAGHVFTLADCAAAPSLFYADWAHPIPERFTHLRAYRARLLARPSFARAVDEARPYRTYFPLGAPDRD